MVVDELCEKLGMDALEFRRLNGAMRATGASMPHPTNASDSWKHLPRPAGIPIILLR